MPGWLGARPRNSLSRADGRPPPVGQKKSRGGEPRIEARICSKPPSAGPKSPHHAACSTLDQSALHRVLRQLGMAEAQLGLAGRSSLVRKPRSRVSGVVPGARRFSLIDVATCWTFALALACSRAWMSRLGCGPGFLLRSTFALLDGLSGPCGSAQRPGSFAMHEVLPTRSYHDVTKLSPRTPPRALLYSVALAVSTASHGDGRPRRSTQPAGNIDWRFSDSFGGVAVAGRISTSGAGLPITARGLLGLAALVGWDAAPPSMGLLGSAPSGRARVRRSFALNRRHETYFTTP